MSDRSGGSESQNFRRLNRMEDVIHSMTTLVNAQMDLSTAQHNQAMAELRELRATIKDSREEIQDLLSLQREQRFDIMALFNRAKDIRERMEKLEGEAPSGA